MCVAATRSARSVLLPNIRFDPICFDSVFGWRGGGRSGIGRLTERVHRPGWSIQESSGSTQDPSGPRVKSSHKRIEEKGRIGTEWLRCGGARARPPPSVPSCPVPSSVNVSLTRTHAESRSRSGAGFFFRCLIILVVLVGVCVQVQPSLLPGPLPG